ARDLDAAAIADHALETDPLVLTAVALPVFGRAEDLLAKQTVAFGLERAVVDRLGFFDFAEGPCTNLLGRCQTDSHRVEIVDVYEVQGFSGAVARWPGLRRALVSRGHVRSPTVAAGRQ